MEGMPKQESKIDEYICRVREGETIESFGEIPESWKEQILQQVNPTELIQSKIRTDFEQLSPDEIREQITLRGSLEYWKRRSSLSDDLFTVGKAHAKEDAEGNIISWEPVSGEIGQHFDAHGIAKLDQLSTLMTLLDTGIDSSRAFYTAPFELPTEDKAGMGAGIGTGDGTAYKTGIAVLTSGYNEKLVTDGIKHVFVNDVYEEMLTPLRALYPQYNFHLLSEQKSVLESEVR